MKRIQVVIFGLLLALSVFVQTTTAQFPPTDARALNSSRVPFLFAQAILRPFRLLSRSARSG